MHKKIRTAARDAAVLYCSIRRAYWTSCVTRSDPYGKSEVRGKRQYLLVSFPVPLFVVFGSDLLATPVVFMMGRRPIIFLRFFRRVRHLSPYLPTLLTEPMKRRPHGRHYCFPRGRQRVYDITLYPLWQIRIASIRLRFPDILSP